MVFNSFEFYLFFAAVVGIYFWLPHGWRWCMLLAASCYFYMAFVPAYILILLATILIDYWAGILIEKSQGPKRKTFLIISIISTCLVLFIFKYFNFFNANMSKLAEFLHWNYPVENLSILLPIGLSFHTFQSLSYVIEVYRGRQKAERHFGIYSLYVMFFPQLVAGPIERPQNLLHQFYEKHSCDYARVTDGLKLMLWGMFKKTVIADRLAVVVDTVYGSPSEFTGVAYIVATVFFAFQIYCDFSGYSDIAIGAAQVLGFRLMDNFNRPYFARSVAEFWKRWHISLSTWFKDYLYIPLGGSRVAVPRMCLNLMITFVISGLWHGASWTYVIWGALNGALLVGSILTRDIRQKWVKMTGLASRPRLHRAVSVIITFTLICFTWIFFRADTVKDACMITGGIGHLFVQAATLDFSFLKDISKIESWGINKFQFGIALVMIGVMEAMHMIQRHANIRHMLRGMPVWQRWPIYYAFMFAIIIFGQGNPKQFIYFQF
ncbi:MAG: MBOAT family protein [Candidatus Omnitrophica bacterium]|nr:MBOAT family protein [Candidatus Omnitrophota bacterium]